MSRALVFLLRVLGKLPLPALRALGAALGYGLYALVLPRRGVVLQNLALCFPEMDEAERARIARRVFVHFAQSWLDRGWLWHAPEAVLAQRLQWQGNVAALQGEKPTIVFAPHFMGLDAGGTGLCAARWHDVASIYAQQSNAVVDAWVREGRSRFGNLHIVSRSQAVRPVISAMRQHQALLYLLPDMDLADEHRNDALFVPFFGVPAATTPALPRFAQLTGAQVVPMVSVLSKTGYTLHVLPTWSHYPSGNVLDDTERMNRELENLIRFYGIDQYYWVHKRFKTRPRRAPAVY